MDGLYLDKYQFSFHSSELSGETTEENFLTFPFPTAFIVTCIARFHAFQQGNLFR